MYAFEDEALASTSKQAESRSDHVGSARRFSASMPAPPHTAPQRTANRCVKLPEFKRLARQAQRLKLPPPVAVTAAAATATATAAATACWPCCCLGRSVGGGGGRNGGCGGGTCRVVRLLAEVRPVLSEHTAERVVDDKTKSTLWLRRTKGSATYWGAGVPRVTCRV